ncbi:MAG: chromosomal replication initiator protein DnaA, partial [Butyrivibrio sp.]|nr:chromosomal replication initiator protein DnaA [Butyrivibrio sp.]
MEDNWENLLTRIRQDADMTDIAYHTWLEPLKVHDLRDGVVIVCVPSDNRIVLSYIEGHYQNFFVVTLSEFLNETVGVRFVMEKELVYNKEETPQNGDVKEPQPPVTAPHPIMEGANLNPKYRFDTFVVGSNNKFAHQASLAVAESPGEAYNPLVLYGGPGLGKTHLMHAIGHFILENRPGTKILYVTSE